MDGAAFLLAFGDRADFTDSSGFVNFLPGGRAPVLDPPARITHTHFQQLALADALPVGPSGPMRAG